MIFFDGNKKELQVKEFNRGEMTRKGNIAINLEKLYTDNLPEAETLKK
jgi:hypothetical protein